MDTQPYAVDLHIHSALSPCGDEDMTPNNIVNMAKLIGLDIIAVADHNTAMNLPAMEKIAIENELLLLPGIEVNTREEIHVLTYFKDVKTALLMGEILYEKLPPILNDRKFFGNQMILNDEDEEIGQIDKLLISAVDLSIEEIAKIARELGGTIVPAHIDRRSFSIISNLGFIPEDLGITTIELSQAYKKGENFIVDGMAERYRVLRSSDAHYLHQIMERGFFIHLKNKTTEALIQKLSG